MQSDEVRKKYLEFFKARKHTEIPPAPLVPHNDPTTLFTSSGMQPLVPYLLGEKHPSGKRLVDIQQCFRATDIDEVGDNRHTTFFEMLGNWSLGDYFKKEQLEWFFGFLVDEIGLDPRRLYVTVFSGDESHGIPRDEESARIWQMLFAKRGIDADIAHIGNEQDGDERGMKDGERIFYYDVTKNWWSRSGTLDLMPVGEPGGPDSEVFYDFGPEYDDESYGEAHPNSESGRFMEIGNSVFMQYAKQNDGSFTELPRMNVDFGGGLERITAASQDEPDIFTSVEGLHRIILFIESHTDVSYRDPEVQRALRIIADHIRGALFMTADGVQPSNTDTGYVLRRLIRRAVRFADVVGLSSNQLGEVAHVALESHLGAYPDLDMHRTEVVSVIRDEETRFRRTLDKGMHEFNRLVTDTDVSGKDAFILFTTYGFPFEFTEELARERGLSVDREGFEEKMQKHKEHSRTASAGKFKGGLADESEEVVKLHTAHHLLLAALQRVLGNEVKQRGSNINAKRLRMDFSFDRKLTEAEKEKIEALVNEWIDADYRVVHREMKKEEAEDIGAEMEFGTKYPDDVSVYFIEDDDGITVSKEFCGGPHATRTGGLGTFRIAKEESSAAGVRRIKATLS